MNYIWIDKQETLENVIDTELMNTKSLALDTEFMGASYYSPKLCVLQICSNDSKTVFLIDGLANLILKSLSCVLHKNEIEKVLHAPKQDIAILENKISVQICNIFDTQLAASFLGFGDQVSLKKLLKDILQIEHQKGQQFSNWEKRPLKEKQLNYAVQDVLHLIELSKELKNKLMQLNRFHWFQEESIYIESARFMENLKSNKKYKIAGKNWLKSYQFALLNHLAVIREDFSRNQNKPREFFLSDFTLVKLVRFYYQNSEDLAGELERLDIPLELKLMIHETVQTKVQIDSFSSENNETRQTEDSKSLSDYLFKKVSEVSSLYQISLPLLATRSEINEFSKQVIQNFSSNEKQIRFLSGWRFSFFGKSLIEEAKQFKKAHEVQSNEN